MSKEIRSRRELIVQKKDDSEEVKDAYQELIEGLYYCLDRELMIPIIGDIVGKEEIFDIDYDKVIKVAKDTTWTTNVTPSERDESDPDAQLTRIDRTGGIPVLPQRKLSINEQLAIFWAREVNYPLVDGYNMARVAQYRVVNSVYPYKAKMEYLLF